MELSPEAVDDRGGATMNPNPLLDPLLGTTVEAHQQELLEAARVTWVSARTGTGDVPGVRGAFSRRFMWRTLDASFHSSMSTRAESSLTVFSGDHGSERRNVREAIRETLASATAVRTRPARSARLRMRSRRVG